MATGADIPPEIVHKIVWHVQDVDEVIYPRDYWRARRTISACSRVCHHWAKLCRPVLFRRVPLKCADDVLTLKEAIDQPSPTLPSIRAFIHILQLIPNESDRPWIHLVFFLLIPKLRANSPKVVLNYRNPSLWTLRGVTNRTDVWGPIPRRPLPLASKITLVVLNGMHFEDATEFCRLIVTFKGLERLELQKITWTSPPVADDFQSLRFRSNALRYIRTDENSVLIAPWLFPSLLARYPVSHRPAPRSTAPPFAQLKGEDHQSLTAILTTFSTPDPKKETVNDPRSIARWHLKDISANSVKQWPGTSHLAIILRRLKLFVEAKIILHQWRATEYSSRKYLLPSIHAFFMPLVDNGPPPLGLYISRIDIDFVEAQGLSETDIATSQWEKFHDVILAMPRLEKLVFWFTHALAVDGLLEEHGKIIENLMQLKHCQVHCYWLQPTGLVDPSFIQRRIRYKHRVL